MSWLSLIPYLLAMALGAGVTWPLARAPLQDTVADLRIENADMRETSAETAKLAALAASRTIQVAQAAGRAAEMRLGKTLARNAQLTKERTDALAAQTTGAACLGSGALGVLNGATGITVGTSGVGLSAPSGSAAAAPGPIATDTGVANWIATAGERFEACREQLHELIVWSERDAATEGKPGE